jgi:hypothetical protein
MPKRQPKRDPDRMWGEASDIGLVGRVVGEPTITHVGERPLAPAPPATVAKPPGKPRKAK